MFEIRFQFSLLNRYMGIGIRIKSQRQKTWPTPLLPFVWRFGRLKVALGWGFAIWWRRLEKEPCAVGDCTEQAWFSLRWLNARCNRHVNSTAA